MLSVDLISRVCFSLWAAYAFLCGPHMLFSAGRVCFSLWAAYAFLCCAAYAFCFPLLAVYAFLISLVGLIIIQTLVFGGATALGQSKIGCLVRRRCWANNRHHDSVNTSTTKAPIKNQTKGSDSLRCNISSPNRVKKLNCFCIAGCEIIASGINRTGGFGFWFLVFGFWFLVFGCCWLLVVGFWFLVFGFEKRDRLVVMGLRRLTSSVWCAVAIARRVPPSHSHSHSVLSSIYPV